jgi:hypothetical protein
MSRKLNALVDPLFISALLVLLLNDFVLKQAFPGLLTGKLSDFSGLIVFAMFWCALLPDKKKYIFPAIAALFVLWKSAASQPLIDLWNSMGLFAVSRVRDWTDLFALAVLPLLYHYRPKPLPVRFLRLPLAVLAIFAFCATSYDSQVKVSARYSFHFSIDELVSRINKLEFACHNPPLSLHFAFADSAIIRGEDTSFVAYGDTIRTFSDTIYKYDRLRKKSTGEIDTIYHYVFRNVDTNYIRGRNTVLLHYDARLLLKEHDQEYSPCFSAKIMITGDADSSAISVKTIDAKGYIHYLKKAFQEEDIPGLLQSSFEKEVIRSIYWK